MVCYLVLQISCKSSLLAKQTWGISMNKLLGSAMSRNINNANTAQHNHLHIYGYTVNCGMYCRQTLLGHRQQDIIWWHHQMETFFALLALCAGNSPVTGEFPSQKPVTQIFDILCDLRLNKRLSKQSWCWWFETPSCSLWRPCYDITINYAPLDFYSVSYRNNLQQPRYIS